MCKHCFSRSDMAEWIPNEFLKPTEEKKHEGILRRILRYIEASLAIVIAVIVPAAIVISGYLIFDLPFKG